MTARPRLGVFRHKAFTIYWSGGLLSNTGTWLQNITAAVHIFLLTQSSVMVGILTAFTFLPILLFGLWGGVASDRYDRRKIIVVTHGASMIATGGLTVLAFLGVVTPAVLIVNAFVVNTAWAFAKPALVTLLPVLVPRDELVEATASNSLQYTLGQFVGPLISAAVLAVSTPAVAYAINTATFLGPIVAISWIWLSVPTASTDGSVPRPWDALKTGIRYAREQPIIAGLLLAVASTAALPEAVRTLSPVYAVDVMSGPESAAGLLVGAQSLGAALALFTMPLLRRSIGARLVSIGVAAQAIGIGIVGLAPNLGLALAGVLIAGAGFAVVFTDLTAGLLDIASDRMRGRVMSLHTVANLGLRPATSLLAGWGATVVDPRIVLMSFVLLAPLTLKSIAHGHGHSAVYHEELFAEASAAMER